MKKIKMKMFEKHYNKSNGTEPPYIVAISGVSAGHNKNIL